MRSVADFYRYRSKLIKSPCLRPAKKGARKIRTSPAETLSLRRTEPSRSDLPKLANTDLQQVGHCFKVPGIAVKCSAALRPPMRLWCPLTSVVCSVTGVTPASFQKLIWRRRSSAFPAPEETQISSPVAERSRSASCGSARNLEKAANAASSAG